MAIVKRRQANAITHKKPAGKLPTARANRGPFRESQAGRLIVNCLAGNLNLHPSQFRVNLFAEVFQDEGRGLGFG